MGTHELSNLKPGDSVMLQSTNDLSWKPATVVSPTKEPRSYMVQTTEGARYRRNQKFLRKITKLPPNIPIDLEDVNTTPTVVVNDSHNRETALPKSHMDKTPSSNVTKKCVTIKDNQEHSELRRSSRISRAPQRLITEV